MEPPDCSTSSLLVGHDDGVRHERLKGVEADGKRKAGAANVFGLALGSWWATTQPERPSNSVENRENFRNKALRTERLIENLPFACWIQDGEGRFIFANSKAHRLLVSDNRIYGRGVEVLGQVQEIRERLHDLTRRALIGGVVREGISYFSGGARYPGIQLITPILAGESVTGLVGLFLEEPDEVGAKHSQGGSEFQSARDLPLSPWAMIAWTPDGMVSDWNGIAELFFGYTKEEAMGKSATALIVPDEQRVTYLEIWRALIVDRTPMRTVLKSRIKSGDVVRREWCSSPLVDPENRIIGVISFARCVPETIQSEASSRESLHLEAMGRLAAGLAHEFNNLLAPMVIEVERISDHAGDPIRVASHVNALRLAIARARELTEKTQWVAGRSSEGREWVNLSELIKSSVERLSSDLDQRIQITLSMDPTLPRLSVAKSALVQILTNLVFNSRDAFSSVFQLGESGSIEPKITITTSHFEGINPIAPARGPRRYQTITVQDNGPGLSEAAQAHAFEPFFTTKSPGSGHGLGLALVWRFAQNHGGWVTLQSKNGQGCELRVFLSEGDSDEAPLKSEMISVSASIRSGHQTGLLLVEDNLLVANALAGVLEDRGYRVLTADTGERAWSLFIEQGDVIDLVLCDLNLPGISGRELLEKIGNSPCPIPVVMMSGYVAYSDTNELNRLGAAALITKPIDPHELLQIVARIVRSTT